MSYWVSPSVKEFNFAGDVQMVGGVQLTVQSDLNGASPQFTLKCISTGGPATIVTWTRDSTTVTEGTQTVFVHPLSAYYKHTLTVTGTLWGLYTCTVSNNKPSSASASVTVIGIYSVSATQFLSVCSSLTSGVGRCFLKRVHQLHET